MVSFFCVVGMFFLVVIVYIFVVLVSECVDSGSGFGGGDGGESGFLLVDKILELFDVVLFGLEWEGVFNLFFFDCV